MTTSISKESVFLIHGTSAADPDRKTDIDEHGRWWQRGSQFWRDLDEVLPAHIRCSAFSDGPNGERLFHWSGKNSESDRRRAGRELFEDLKNVSAPFHLVGHSHGGSVIWHALCYATMNGERLPHLKSWTTLGTPFLHFSPRVDLLALVPLFLASAFGSYLLVGIAGEHYDPAIGLNVPTAILWTLSACSALMAVAFICKLLASFSNVLRHDWGYHRTVADTFIRHGNSGLHLWSPDDEAINGLSRTVGGLEGSFLPRIGSISPHKTPRIIERLGDASMWFWDRTATMSFPFEETLIGDVLIGPIVTAAGSCVMFISLPFVLLYLVCLGGFRALQLLFTAGPTALNGLLPENAERLVMSRLTRISQGSDVSGLGLVAVSPSPSLKSAGHQLSDDITSQLKRNADQAAQRFIPSVRGVLGQSGMSESNVLLLIKQLTENLQGNELVHTGYYRNRDVIEEIADFIAGESPVVMLDRSDAMSKYASVRLNSRDLKFWLFALPATTIVCGGVTYLSLAFAHALFSNAFGSALQTILNHLPF